MVKTTHKSDAVSLCLEVDQLMKLKGVRACKLQLGTARNKVAKSIFRDVHSRFSVVKGCIKKS